MILLVVEFQKMRQMFELIEAMLKSKGEDVVLLDLSQVQPRPDIIIPAPRELVSAVVAHNVIGPRQKLSELVTACDDWYSVMYEYIERTAPSIVVGWGGATIVTRAAMVACDHVKRDAIFVSVESPLLPTDLVSVYNSCIMTAKAPYFELTSQDFSGYRYKDYNKNEIESYISWWKTNKKTKPFHERTVKEVELPRNLTRDCYSIVFFDQMRNDAARIWQTSGEDERRMYYDLEYSQIPVWAKQHPMDTEDRDYAKLGLLPLSKTASIHSVFPHTNLVVTMNSNVGLEAWFYDLQVAVYGDAIYNQFGLVGTSIYDDLSFDRNERLRFIAYLRDFHVPFLATEFTRKLRGIAEKEEEK